MTYTCTIKLKDEISAVLLGVLPNHLKGLVEELQEYVPGYKYMPLFKMGVWDGKVKFCTAGGKTYQAMLPEVLDYLKPLGYKFKLIDERQPIDIDVPLVDENLFAEHQWFLRPHQVAAINAISNNNHRGLIIAATGSGKTTICAGISKVYENVGFRSMVIVPSVDLIRQTYETYVKLGLDTGQYSGKVKDLDHQHIISTWQALKNHPEILLRFQVLMIDEAHGAKSDIVSKLLIKHGSHIPVRIGCTGTLPKDAADYKTIYAAIGAKEVYEITAKELQSQELLATLHITQMQMQDSRDPAKEVFPEYAMEKQAVSVIPGRVEWIGQFVRTLAETQGNTLVLVASIPQGRKMQQAVGEHATFLYGKDDNDVRKQVYESFATNDNLAVIANVQIAGTGLSIDRIFNLVLVDLGKGFTRVIQAIGRGLRLGHDKDHVDVYDIGTNFVFGNNHMKKRKQYYNEAGYPVSTTKIKYPRIEQQLPPKQKLRKSKKKELAQDDIS